MLRAEWGMFRQRFTGGAATRCWGSGRDGRFGGLFVGSGEEIEAALIGLRHMILV